MITRSSRSSLIALTFVSAVSLHVVLDSMAQAQARIQGPRVGIVVDERLSVLRDSPNLSGKLLRRIGRGRVVTLTGQSRTSGGVTFYFVAVTRRTRGWLQKESLIIPRRAGEDERLLRLVLASTEFDRVARARIFLNAFAHSPFRARVLLLFGDTVEHAADKLSQDALRRLDPKEMQANDAPVSSYALNYAGLDRYNRQGVRFTFDYVRRKFHYEGGAWREIIRRYPHSPEAAEARMRLAARLSMID
jgi:hypothetical protein